MPMEKKKMPVEKKLKLIYCGELGLFAIIFAVLGSLFVAGVITPADWKRYVFTYLTLAGSIWLVIDFFWALLSPKRRKKVCLLDKALVLPVAPVLITFDIICIINLCSETMPYRYFIGFDLLYLAIVYCFQAIYHYFHPTKQMEDIIQEALKEEQEKENPAEPQQNFDNEVMESSGDNQENEGE